MSAVRFNGRRYSVDKSNGYMRATSVPHTYLHRDMWIFHRGPIPKGFDIHHKDLNKTHNWIGNFECLSNVEHQLLYSAVRKEIPTKWCKTCQAPIPRRDSTGTAVSPCHYQKKMFCSPQCAGISRRGRISTCPKATPPIEVREIKNLCGNGVSRREVAAVYALSVSAIAAIMSGQNHRSVR